MHTDPQQVDIQEGEKGTTRGGMEKAERIRRNVERSEKKKAGNLSRPPNGLKTRPT